MTQIMVTDRFRQKRHIHVQPAQEFFKPIAPSVFIDPRQFLNVRQLYGREQRDDQAFSGGRNATFGSCGNWPITSRSLQLKDERARI